MKKLFMLVAVVTMSICAANAQTFAASYGGEVDLGYSSGLESFSSGRVNLHTIQGVRAGRYFFTGLGLGMDYYHDLEEIVVPLYLNLKGFLPVSKKSGAFFSLDIGLGIGTGSLSGSSGLYCTPAFGFNAGSFKAQLGYNIQHISKYGIEGDMRAIQLKLGVMF